MILPESPFCCGVRNISVRQFPLNSAKGLRCLFQGITGALPIRVLRAIPSSIPGWHLNYPGQSSQPCPLLDHGKAAELLGSIGSMPFDLVRLLGMRGFSSSLTHASLQRLDARWIVMFKSFLRRPATLLALAGLLYSPVALAAC